MASLSFSKLINMLEDFKLDLNNHTSLQLIRKYILGGACYVLSEEKILHLKEEISEHFGVEFHNVIMVGSGKLGFSIKSEKRFQAFGNDSDIDIAVVADGLFKKVWEEAFLYKKSGADWPKAESFFKYLSQGWIRPDKLPTSEYFVFSAKWWDFFNELTANKRYGPYKIRGGLYYSMFFLQEYQKICIEQCIEELN
jgi:hypothetical protein